MVLSVSDSVAFNSPVARTRMSRKKGGLVIEFAVLLENRSIDETVCCVVAYFTGIIFKIYQLARARSTY